MKNSTAFKILALLVLLVVGGLFVVYNNKANNTGKVLATQTQMNQDEKQIEKTNNITDAKDVIPALKDFDKIKSNNILEDESSEYSVNSESDQNCDLFSSKLASCAQYKCQFIHPFTEETMEKEIMGVINEKCHYEEQMPNNGKMTCDYDEDTRMAVAQYYTDIVDNEDDEEGVHIELEGEEYEITYTINGEEVLNPLQEVMDRGICVISGYDDYSENNNSSLSGILEIEWGEFVKATDSSGRDSWKMDIKIINNENKDVVLSFDGSNPDENWGWGTKSMVDSGDDKVYDLTIRHYSFDKVKYDKKYIKLSFYECNKLSVRDEEDICLSSFGFDGTLSPWEVLENREDAGDPISPTLVSEKYFNFDSLTTPPLEISREDYLK